MATITEEQWEERMWELLEDCFEGGCFIPYAFDELGEHIIFAFTDNERLQIAIWNKNRVLERVKRAYKSISTSEDWEVDDAFLELGGPWGC